ncbi:hypothetical protein WOLCODRAFT_82882 [Wolfiporia cocos MD-104 SS10]|uniref:Nucleotidyltransferase n=1 Tax=Wolfiporia cocos (strain MD-104) TaxID=742152 RepID=A0A2H3J5I5_WOLCO|nr:hypothetical protein WOLCODRAFT_82882 [Wolfiporia cocos MD-104 SS10]
MVPTKPTNEEILDIAREAISIFNENDYDCCLFGSAACALYGMDRDPNDVDIIVLTEDHTECLQRLLCKESASFFLVESTKPWANYKVLWYELPSLKSGPQRKCKVDILTPGIMHIPNMPPRRINHPKGLPALPILPLLLLKLQGWSDLRRSCRKDLRAKIPVDEDDITELLIIACLRGTRLGSQSLGWLPKDFVEAAQKRVYRYVNKYPQSARKWERLGFAAYR